MASSDVIVQVGNRYERWEGNKTWPHVNKVFNVSAFNYPEKRFTTASQAPHQRAKGYPNLAVNFATRGNPQLTWFEGSYDVMAHLNNTPQFCKYPRLPTSMKNYRRECKEPGKLTAAELAAIRAKQVEVEKAISQSLTDQRKLEASNPKWECTQTYQGADGKRHTGLKVVHNGKTYTAYSKRLADGSTQYYDCATNSLIRTMGPQVVRGLGETELEKKVIANQKATYRTTELALAGAFAVGLLVVWRS
jgi:hypothetical protein